MAIDFAAFAAALKVRYTKDEVQNLVHEGSGAFLDLVKKEEKADGLQWDIPLIYGDPQGISADGTTALTNGALSDGSMSKFSITLKDRFGVVTLSSKTIKASSSTEGAFFKSSTYGIDGLLRAMGRTLGTASYRSGWGDVGQVSAIGSNVITLSRKEDVVNFERGMRLVFSSSQNGAVLRDSGNTGTVTAVNRMAGTVTISSTPAAVAANDFIFPQGDRENSATPTVRLINGLESWVPATAPSSTTFNGVDRSLDPTRLGGLRFDGTGGAPVQEVLYEAAALAAREGAKLSHFFMPFSQWIALEKALDGKATVVDEKTADSVIGYKAIVVRSPAGDVKCIADKFCPGNRIFGVQLDTWKLYSLGQAVTIFDGDGNTMLRQSSTFNYEVRAESYAELACSAPGYNINIQVQNLGG